METLQALYDFLCPRFITEWVVLVDHDDHYEPLCSLPSLPEWEFDPSMRFQKWRSFNLFGQAINPNPISGIYQVNRFSELDELYSL